MNDEEVRDYRIDIFHGSATGWRISDIKTLFVGEGNSEAEAWKNLTDQISTALLKQREVVTQVKREMEDDIKEIGEREKSDRWIEAYDAGLVQSCQNTLFFFREYEKKNNAS